MKNLVILVGNIGCGKSTLAKEIQKEGYIVIARDSLRYAIGAGKYIFDYDYEDIIWKTELYMFKKFIDKGVNILVDEVGLTKRMRERYVPYAKKLGYNIVAIELPKLSMKNAVDNRMKSPHDQNDRKTWEQIWSKFDSVYESPSIKEGIDEVIKL